MASLAFAAASAGCSVRKALGRLAALSSLRRHTLPNHFKCTVHRLVAQPTTRAPALRSYTTSTKTLAVQGIRPGRHTEAVERQSTPKPAVPSGPRHTRSRHWSCPNDSANTISPAANSHVQPAAGPTQPASARRHFSQRRTARGCFRQDQRRHATKNTHAYSDLRAPSAHTASEPHDLAASILQRPARLSPFSPPRRA